METIQIDAKFEREFWAQWRAFIEAKEAALREASGTTIFDDPVRDAAADSGFVRFWFVPREFLESLLSIPFSRICCQEDGVDDRQSRTNWPGDH